MGTLLESILKRIEQKQELQPAEDLSPKGLFGEAEEGEVGLPKDQKNLNEPGDQDKTKEQDLPAPPTQGRITGSGDGEEL